MRAGRVQAGQRPGGEHEPGAERDQAAQLVARGPGPAADAEGEPPVDRRVGDRGHEQADRVGRLGPHHRPQEQVEQHEGHRAGHADQDEPHQLAGHLIRPRTTGAAPFLQARRGCAAQDRNGDRTPGQRGAEPDDAAQVGQGGAGHVDPGVRVVDPVHRHLMDPQPGPLGQYEQLGVEEPAVVGGQRQKLAGGVGADRLEPALRIGEACAEGGVQQEVVGTRDEFPARAAHYPRAPRQPGADRHVAVPGEQGREQREQRVQVGGQVDVHVGVHVGVAGRPDGAQRPAAARPLDLDGPDRRQLGLQRHGLRPGAVGAAVVRDGDPRGDRELIPKVSVQPPDAGRQVVVLVADRNDDFDLHAVRGPRRPGPPGIGGVEQGVSRSHARQD
jgi:hypothetical protein